MHDGRARSLSEAISLHNGDAALSGARFHALSDFDKAELIRFLKTL